VDSTRRANSSDQERPQTAALWRAVRPESRPHPVDAPTLGEFAVLAHRRGLREAAQAFPHVAAHLQLDEHLVREERWTPDALAGTVYRHCEKCASDLHELLQFVEAEWGPRQPFRPDWSAPPHHAASLQLSTVMAAPPATSRSVEARYSMAGRVDDRTRVYEIGHSTITQRLGDITASGADALVSSDDARLSMGGGVSAAILRAAGERVREEARKLVRLEHSRVGNVFVTSAGNLRAKYVLHAITIGPGSDEIEPDAIVRQAVQRVMRLAPLLGCRSIALPAIGTGVAGIPFEIASGEMGQALVDTLRRGQHPLNVELYLMDRFGVTAPEQLFAYFEQAIQRTLGLEALPDDGAIRLATPEEFAALTRGPSDAEEVRRRQGIVRMLRDLDARRSELETALIRAVAAKDPRSAEQLLHIRKQLHELRALRESYEEELTGIPQPLVVIPRTIFLSSTRADLQPHRQRVRQVIERLEYGFIGMEEFAASPEPPGVLIRRKVEQAEIYVGVLGMRYGAVDESSGFSMTELEYQQAVTSKKPIYMFVIDDKAPITVDLVETDPERYAKLRRFRDRVTNAHVVGLFMDVDDLERKAEETLRNAIQGA
jgi:O-acetyl-ADP-ribose deacetylase (regulator of RNase III)